MADKQSIENKIELLRKKFNYYMCVGMITEAREVQEEIDKLTEELQG